MRYNVAQVQFQIEYFANKSCNPALEYYVNNLVYLDAYNLPIMRPNKGLSAKNLSLYCVKVVLDKYAVVLNFPNCYKNVYLVFYLQLLHLADRATTISTEGEIVYERLEGNYNYYVNEIVNYRINKCIKDPLTSKKGMQQYKVKYTNLPNQNAALVQQPYTDLQGAEEAVYNYY